ncbi:hypothetical protein, conserved [Leishmania tarentolae]|uniref:Uncharacterized protein n=1 Tax=Leishmania tarentolae TaxID=5689 RepID=A0A640KH39_LEITA|nr:hypothetical protein, conserved [Leishmania tarentolae]
MRPQGSTALQRLQLQQESVNNPVMPVSASSQKPQQRQTSMPSTLSEALHQFYRVHTQLEPQQQQQQQPPPLVRGPPLAAPPNALATRRLSVSVTPSHSRDRSVSEMPVESHCDGEKALNKRQGKLTQQFPVKVSHTVTFSSEGERESSASQGPSGLPPDSSATAAPPLRPEVLIPSYTVDSNPTHPLAGSHDRAASVALRTSEAPTDTSDAPHRRPSPSTEAAAEDERRPTSSGSVADELQRTRQKLAELQRLCSFEKQAHLQQRTQQLREEAQRRQSEDDITERTVQLLSDYESLIRFRDTASQEHLEGVLQRVTEEWKRSAESLEQTRATCEASLLSRLHRSLAEQQDALAKRLEQHLVSVAKSTVETQRAQSAAISTAVQEQVASFKEEYRLVLEQDMAERQRLMDEQVAHREAQWCSFLKDEHARMIAAGEAAAREANRRQLETLHIAMRDITTLREQLLHEHARRQAQVGHEYLVAYESLANEYVAFTEETAEYVQRLQHDYASIIRALHTELSRVSEEKQEVVRRSEHCSLQAAEAVAQKLHSAEEVVDSRWQARWAAEQEAHRASVLRLTRLHEETLEKVRSSSAAKEAKLKAAHERERAAWEEHQARQLEQQTAAVDDALQSVQATVQKLEREKESLSSQVQQLKDQLRREELAHEAAVQDARQAEEARCKSLLSNLEASYDSVLQQYKEKLKTACNGGDGSGAGLTTATAAVKRVAELEKELQETQSENAARVQQAVEEAVSLWSVRLEECREQQRAHCKAMEQQHRALRTALLEEVQRREQALEENRVAERRAHQEELQNVLIREKEASKRALEYLERQHVAAQRQAEAEVERRARAGEDALAVREKQLELAEAEWQRRLVEEKNASLQQLTAHAAAQHAKQLAELEEQEVILRSEQAQLAQQKAVMEQDIRRVLRCEMEMRLAEQLAAAQKGWIQLLEAELLQRFTTWQELRMQELACVRQLHREEMHLYGQHHAAQIASLKDEQQRHLSQEEEAMRAREAAWAAARTASLDAYSEAAAARLQEVLEVERAQWHAAQQQNAAERGASIEAAASCVVEHFAITEATRAQLEEEARSSYLATLEQQQARMSELLAEQRRRHEEAIAQVRASFVELAEKQAAQFEKDREARDREHEAYVREVRETFERQLATQRSQHAAALAAERSVAQDGLRRLQQQTDAAREAYEKAATKRMHDVRHLYEQQIAELQKCLDAQASQLCGTETELYLLEQRIRDEQAAKVRTEYEESISGLRNAIEERNRSYAELQASLYARVQAEADRIQAGADEKAARFMEQQQRHLAELLLAHEKALEEQQQRHQEDLTRLQARHEADLTAQACNLRSEHKDAEALLQSRWETQQEHWRKLLEDERRDRCAADERANAATANAAELRVVWEEQQAAAYRALDEQYRRLLEQIRNDMQVEREELARRSLEEEEQRFAAEMLQRRHAHRQPPRAPSQQVQSPSTRSRPTSSTPILVAAPESQTPLGRRRSRGVADVALSTPAALCSATSQGSPLLISPAAPVELPAVHHRHSHEEEPPEDLLQRAKQRLRQLWDVLEVPSDDQRSFLSYADSLAQEAPAAELHDALMREQRRLEAQLPLLEALTRREYVQRQLHTVANARPLGTLSMNGKSDVRWKCLSAADGDYDNHDTAHAPIPSSSSRDVLTDDEENAVASSAVSTPTQARGRGAGGPQLEQLTLEFRRLTEQLRRSITQHEKEYGQLFCVHGTRVMDTL